MNEKTRGLFRATGVEQALFFSHHSSQPYFSYFTGLPLKQFEGNALVLAKGKKPAIITGSLWRGLLEERKEFDVFEAESRKAFVEILLKRLPEEKTGVNFHDFSAAGLSRLKGRLKGKRLVNISRELEKLRETKTKDEIKKIGRAVKITERALEIVPSLVKKGITEVGLAKRLEIEMLEGGADTTAFPAIAATGKNGMIPHYISAEKKISKGFLVVDCGARFENYCADLSRTFFVGRASEKQKALYGMIFRAKHEAEKKAIPGAKAMELMKAAETVLARHNCKMIHSLGHGIGLQDHDFPAGIGLKSQWKLAQGMCFTIEPAIYGAFGGIRLEDDYVMEKKGLRPFSRAPKELVEI